MDKPDWKDAPEWAMWVAQDSVGGYTDHYWVWFEKEPEAMQTGWIDHSPDGRWHQTTVVATSNDWRNTLEPRP